MLQTILIFLELFSKHFFSLLLLLLLIWCLCVFVFQFLWFIIWKPRFVYSAHNVHISNQYLLYGFIVSSLRKFNCSIGILTPVCRRRHRCRHTPNGHTPPTSGNRRRSLKKQERNLKKTTVSSIRYAENYWHLIHEIWRWQRNRVNCLDTQTEREGERDREENERQRDGRAHDAASTEINISILICLVLPVKWIEMERNKSEPYRRTCFSVWHGELWKWFVFKWKTQGIKKIESNNEYSKWNWIWNACLCNGF